MNASRYVTLLALIACLAACESMRTAAFNSAMNRHPAPPDVGALAVPAGDELAASYRRILADHGTLFAGIGGAALSREERDRRLGEFTAARNAYLKEKMEAGATRVDALRAYQADLAGLEEALMSMRRSVVTPPGAETGAVSRSDDNYNEATGNSYDYAEVVHFFPASDHDAAIALMERLQTRLSTMGFAAEGWTVEDVAFSWLYESAFGQRKDQYYGEFNMKGFIQTDRLDLELTVVDGDDGRHGVRSRVYALVHTN